VKTLNTTDKGCAQ